MIAATACISLCSGNELYKPPEQKSESYYAIISNLEMQVYSKEYSNDNLSARVDRLEITIYGHKSNEPLRKRLEEIQKTLNSKYEKKCDDKNEIMLSLLEKKYFNADYPSDSNEKRLSRIETQIYGKPATGETKARLNNLFQKAPLNTTGISLSDKSGSNAIYMPSKSSNTNINQKHMSIPVKQDNNNIKSSSEEETHIYAINNKIPVKVFIAPSNDSYFKECARKAVGFWKPYYNVELTQDYESSNIIIDMSNKSIINEIKDKVLFPKQKIIIYSGNYLGNKYLDTILAHELGHAFGIREHSNNPADIMYDFKELHFDIETKRDIYSQNQSIITAPQKPSYRDLEALLKVY